MEENQRISEKANFEHEKNRKEAEKQAMDMLNSAQNEAQQNAQEKLSEIA